MTLLATATLISASCQSLALQQVDPINTIQVAHLSPTATHTSTPSTTPRAQLPQTTSTPTLHIPFFGSVTVTPSPTVTPSVTPQKFISKHALDTPVGTDRKFIIKRLAQNEALDPYLLQFNTDIHAVAALNYDLRIVNPIDRDILIIFPVNFTDVSGLHTLYIYKIKEIERGANYEFLADILNFDLNDFKYYNAITNEDRPIVGDYYLIPQKRLIP